MITILFLMCISQARSHEIHLQKDEVVGQIRRPQVDWVDAKTRATQLVPKVYASKIQEFEKDILQPKSNQKAEDPNE